MWLSSYESGHETCHRASNCSSSGSGHEGSELLLLALATARLPNPTCDACRAARDRLTMRAWGRRVFSGWKRPRSAEAEHRGEARRCGTAGALTALAVTEGRALLELCSQPSAGVLLLVSQVVGSDLQSQSSGLSQTDSWPSTHSQPESSSSY